MPGYVYASVNCPALDSMRSYVSRKDIAEELPKWCPTGIEVDSHCTIYYGIDDVLDRKEVGKKYRDFFSRRSPLIFTPGKVVSFDDNPSWDCIVVEAKEGLNRNRLVSLHNGFKRVFGYEGSEYEYHPHITLAYVKKGKGKVYARKFNASIFVGYQNMYIHDVYVSYTDKQKGEIVEVFALGV